MEWILGSELIINFVRGRRVRALGMLRPSDIQPKVRVDYGFVPAETSLARLGWLAVLDLGRVQFDRDAPPIQHV